MDYKMIGKVKWFNAEKGYGFIQCPDGKEAFVHYSQILQDGYKSLEDGQKVNFNLIETGRGIQATNVEVIDE